MVTAWIKEKKLNPILKTFFTNVKIFNSSLKLILVIEHEFSKINNIENTLTFSNKPISCRYF